MTGRVTPVVLELTDFDSIVACADEIQAMGEAMAARLWEVSEELTRDYLL